jgi:hypothetical protein
MAALFLRAYLDQLRSRKRLSDLISRCGVKLVRRGQEFVGLCPFHSERTPTFSVVDEKHFFTASAVVRRATSSASSCAATISISLRR